MYTLQISCFRMGNQEKEVKAGRKGEIGEVKGRTCRGPEDEVCEWAGSSGNLEPTLCGWSVL